MVLLCWVGCIYIYNCYVFLLDWSFNHYVVSVFVSCDLLYLKSVLSDTSIATSAFLWFPCACNIFFHPLTLSLYMSSDLKWISSIQNIYRSCFCIHSLSLCLLVRAFNPFTFSVIMDSYVLIVILLIFRDCYFGSFFFFPSSFVVFSWICWPYLVLCLSCFSFLALCLLQLFDLCFPLYFDFTIRMCAELFLVAGLLIFKCIFNVLHLSSPLLMLASFDIIFVSRWFPTFILSLPLTSELFLL